MWSSSVVRTHYNTSIYKKIQGGVFHCGVHSIFDVSYGNKRLDAMKSTTKMNWHLASTPLVSSQVITNIPLFLSISIKIEDTYSLPLLTTKPDQMFHAQNVLTFTFYRKKKNLRRERFDLLLSFLNIYVHMST